MECAEQIRPRCWGVGCCWVGVLRFWLYQSDFFLPSVTKDSLNEGDYVFFTANSNEELRHELELIKAQMQQIAKHRRARISSMQCEMNIMQ